MPLRPERMLRKGVPSSTPQSPKALKLVGFSPRSKPAPSLLLVHFPEKLLQLRRQLTLKRDHRPSPRMPKLQLGRMQEIPREDDDSIFSARLFRSPIHRIPHHGMPHCRHMHPNLMSPPGID